MRLSQLLPGGPEIEVAGIAYDSRKVRPGFVFVAIPRVPLDKAPGDHRDGHDFVSAAAKAGAAAAVVERRVEVDIPQIIVSSSRQTLADLAAAFYAHPGRRLRLLGITGTDGKTTTVHLVSQLLESFGRLTGFATTTDFKVASRHWDNLSRQTTMEALEIQEILRQMVDARCSHAILEATSQGLEQERLRGCQFDAAAFTNVTSDHLDWHKTRENYLAAKRRLFEQLKPSGTAILNADDDSTEYFRLPIRGRVVTYGAAAPADIRASNIRYQTGRLVFRLDYPNGASEIIMNLLGRFNVHNALAAAALAWAEGSSIEDIAAGLEAAKPAPGRMEAISAGQPFRVLVDYAHTPNSFESVLRDGRAMADEFGGRLLVVFGCSGERDPAKRPAMGRLAAELADLSVLTDEDPHSEDPRRIVREIAAGASGGNYQVELDRRKAMAAAFRQARPQDVVLVTGKGHERSMIVAGERKVDWDEREIAREELRKLYG